LIGVWQSSKEAHQPLQDAQNQPVGLNQPKNGPFHQISSSTQRRKGAKTPSQMFLCAFMSLRLCVKTINT
jgi:hypothetical protein